VEYRIEHDTMGPVRVPAEALYGAQTQRAIENFPISGLPMPARLVGGLIKSSAAVVNGRLEFADLARATRAATVAEGNMTPISWWTSFRPAAAFNQHER
jgi:fumarate hydratase class II